ncbi:MAG: ketoacyl-ACP synthase III [Acidimicrobiaceae bacterium]|nr:ketoacyl-ACP synthase III [Acidimicrobiaceae bacterium]
MGARLAGIGTSLPEKVLTNDDLAQMMDTSDEWIRERTGIRERRIGLPTSSLGIESGRAAIDMAGLDPTDIDLLILSTTTPDQRVPGTAAVIHAELGLDCGAFDLNAACAGFTYGWVVAHSMLDAPGGPRRVLLVGADALSPITDWEDRGTAILFSDGGGAVVLEHTDDDTLLGWDLGADGNHRRLLMGDHDSKITMEGREVFKVAVRAVTGSVLTALDRAGMGPGDVDVLLPHQANIRIIEAICKRTGIPFERSYNTIEHTGNNSSGTIPLAMAKAHAEGALQPGAIVVMTGFGAGMSWATTVSRW